MADVCPQRKQPQQPQQPQQQQQQQQQQAQQPARGRAFLLTTAQAQNANDVITVDAPYALAGSTTASVYDQDFRLIFYTRDSFLHHDRHHQFSQFHGRDDEDAPAHINRITRLCSTFSIEGVNLDARYLQVFPFSLIGRAAVWFDSQPAGTFNTWAGLRDAFLAKYFLPAKASRLRDQIHSFRMEPDEPYHLAWERFQTLISRCSQHGLSDWALVEKFYNGLTPEIRARFDTSSGGQLMGKKTVAECNDLFESFAHSDMDYITTSRTSIPVRTTSAGRGVNQVSLDPSVATAVEDLRKEMRQELNEIKKKVDRCEVCRGGHDTIDCPTITLEQVEYIAGQSRGPTNPFNNSNSGWRGSSNSSGYRSSGNPPGFPSGQYQSRGPDIYTS
ncbi:uncharacterized protein LOC110913991 [Helianthus annuus]|uniref:uncharacterized protein LOC110913991 n=1 Tax=Helianthus annuus TaxID=4232 RepID=UPI000B8F9F21|nr:uncharacterized protein LOC110913991 [Helianthus annuus]